MRSFREATRGEPDVEGNVGFRREEDEDENLGRVGSLARGQPIFPFIETLRHSYGTRFGMHRNEVRERRPGNVARPWREGRTP